MLLLALALMPRPASAQTWEPTHSNPAQVHNVPSRDAQLLGPRATALPRTALDRRDRHPAARQVTAAPMPVVTPRIIAEPTLRRRRP
jgi:hypothetical protein